MNLRLTEKLLAKAYEYHRASHPYEMWSLPVCHKVKFRVGRKTKLIAELRGYCRSSEAEIIVSERLVGTTYTLMVAMAHEMIHLYQHINKTETPNTQHNAEFNKMARLVCRYHGYDPRAF